MTSPRLAGQPDIVRIANCSGYFGDRLTAAAELLADAEIDVLTGDWLAELTMIILAGQRRKNPTAGFASTFLTVVEQVLGTCLDRHIPIVTNAGGLNPQGCAEALGDLATRLGLTLEVGYVSGDDLMGRFQRLTEDRQLFEPSGARSLTLDEAPIVANAYLGGWGIASCLQRGADVVVTGRVTDASLLMGPAAAAFAWAEDDWDALAGALVAGHVIECGAQATGGNYAHFDREVPSMRHVGFPVAEVYRDGTSVITKGRNSDGVVTLGTVKAQLLYEIGSARYFNPDVIARLDSIRLSDDGPDRVRISGVRGEPPTDRLKVAVATNGGYRNAMMIAITGMSSERKAEVALDAIWANIPGGEGTFDEVAVELIGRPATDDGGWGSQAAATCVLRIAVAGSDPGLVGRTFSSAVTATGLSSYPGFYSSGPPGPASAFATYHPALVTAAACPTLATVGGNSHTIPAVGATRGVPVDPIDSVTPLGEPAGLGPAGSDEATTWAPLGQLVGARSGDKGGDANVGVWCADEPSFEWLRGYLTTARLVELVPEAHGLAISRYELPNLQALNFVVSGFLGAGVSSCLRFDGQAKALAEFLRSRVVPVPTRLIARV